MATKSVKIEIISKQFIKPALSTPQEKSTFKLSIVDELNYVMSTPLVLFYPATDIGPQNDVVSYLAGKSRLLKSSLADTLTLYYPYAGVLKSDNLIHCNDSGIEYVEARVAGTLDDVVFRRPDLEFLENFLRIDDLNSARYVGAKVQTTAFACGGLAVAISLTHKIGDGASLLTFLQAWAAATVARTSSAPIPSEVHPVFAVDSVVVSSSDVEVAVPKPPPASREQVRTVLRRFVFGSGQIERIRAMCVSEAVKRPTRVESVTAVVWRALMKVNKVKRSAAGDQNQKVCALGRILAGYEDTNKYRNVGNLSGKAICTAPNGSEEDLKALVAHERAAFIESNKPLSKGREQDQNDVVETIVNFANEFKALHARHDVDLYSFSSLLTFEFHDVDFGWGKPGWVTFTNLILKQFVLFLDDVETQGFNVMVSVSEDVAGLLDRELVGFAESNPPVGWRRESVSGSRMVMSRI
ncbi:Minovincinine 19-hydroxy-O-acetyltransferase [Linum perenne]